MSDLAGDVHEYSGWRDKACVVSQVAVSHKPVECVHIIAHLDSDPVAGPDSPGIFCNLFASQRIPCSILGTKIQHIPGVIHDPVITRCPGRHFEIMHLAFHPFATEDDMIIMTAWLLHGHGEGHAALRLLARREGGGNKKCEAKNDHPGTGLHLYGFLHLITSCSFCSCPLIHNR